MKLRELVRYLDARLDPGRFPEDPSNNGLQVEAGDEVRTAVFGVDASQALIDFAIENGADFVFAHHGLSWRAEPRRLVGIDAVRFGKLFRAGISLYAAHLPLDAHPEIGNNAELSRMAGLTRLEPCCRYAGVSIGFQGVPSAGTTPEKLAALFAADLDCAPRIFGDAKKTLSRVAVVSGGGGMDALADAAACGAELLLTGVMEPEMFHPAAELGVAVLALGHYASETTGPRAVMREIEKRFGIAVRFAELPTGL